MNVFPSPETKRQLITMFLTSAIIGGFGRIGFYVFSYFNWELLEFISLGVGIIAGTVASGVFLFVVAWIVYSAVYTMLYGIGEEN